jgi:hypothetical protein
MRSLADISQATPEQVMKGKGSMAPDKAPMPSLVNSEPTPAWTRSMEGTLKLNIDGAFVAETR